MISLPETSTTDFIIMWKIVRKVDELFNVPMTAVYQWSYIAMEYSTVLMVRMKVQNVRNINVLVFTGVEGPTFVYPCTTFVILNALIVHTTTMNCTVIWPVLKIPALV